MNTQKIKTSIRAAFEAIAVKKSAFTAEGARIGAIIHAANGKGFGIINRSEWNASLSLKTAKMLGATTGWDKVNQGNRYAYDAMVQE